MATTPAMEIWAVIAVSDGVEMDGRLHYSRSVFTHVLATTIDLFPARHTVIVSHQDEALTMARQAGARSIRADRQSDINDDLAHGAAFAADRGARAILALTADLPHLDRADLDAMLLAYSGANVVLATDRSGTACIASLMPPDCLPYRHGRAGMWNQLAAAQEANLPFNIVRRDKLTRHFEANSDKLTT